MKTLFFPASIFMTYQMKTVHTGVTHDWIINVWSSDDWLAHGIRFLSNFYSFYTTIYFSSTYFCPKLFSKDFMPLKCLFEVNSLSNIFSNGREFPKVSLWSKFSPSKVSMEKKCVPWSTYSSKTEQKETKKYLLEKTYSPATFFLKFMEPKNSFFCIDTLPFIIM